MLDTYSYGARDRTELRYTLEYLKDIRSYIRIRFNHILYTYVMRIEALISRSAKSKSHT